MFGQGVAEYVDAAGPQAILSLVATRLAGADLTLGNLESPLTSSGRPVKGKDITLRGNPKAVAALSRAGFDALGLANNHALDYGPTGLRSTLTLLDRARIAHAGAGVTVAAARKPAELRARGARVAFLSYSHIRPAGFVAGDTRPGIAESRNDSMDRVVAEIRRAKATHGIVIVAFHWGVEHKDSATEEQIADGHRAVDAGADLVLGTHPHVIQAIESYKGKVIAYSLGDFVFDHSQRKAGESFIMTTELGPKGTGRVLIVPTYLGSGNGRPAIVKGSAARTILQRLKVLSAKLDTDVVIRGDQATVEIK